MEDKKKRGNNYTAHEKEILLELINNHMNIIENKETNAQISLTKRKTWEAVCQQYNAVAVSGVRTWQQLRHFYENIKQRSKKNIQEINQTGPYKNSHTEEDAQAMIAIKIEPLSNPCDDAALPDNETAATVTQSCNNTELLSSSRNTGRRRLKQCENYYKLQYFKAKLRNAQLENKYIINKNRMELNKYKLEMEILKLRLQKLKSHR